MQMLTSSPLMPVDSRSVLAYVAVYHHEPVFGNCFFVVLMLTRSYQHIHPDGGRQDFNGGEKQASTVSLEAGRHGRN